MTERVLVILQYSAEFESDWLQPQPAPEELSYIFVTFSFGQVQGSVPPLIGWILVSHLVHDEDADVQVTLACSQMKGSGPTISLWVLLLNLFNDKATDVQVTIICSSV